jgi:hypothetical protein
MSRPFYRGPQVESSRDGRFYVWRGRNYWSVTTIIGGGLPKPALINWAKKFTAEYAVEHLEALKALVADDPKGAVAWLKDAAYRDRDRKADLGSHAHDAAEAYVLKQPFPEWPPEVAAIMTGFLNWLKDWSPVFTAVECPVFNDSHRYAGRLDAIIEIATEDLPACPMWGETPTDRPWRVLADYKTGKGIYSDVALQLAAYRHAETFLGLPDGSEAPMPDVDGCAVVHLRPNGTYQFLPIQTDEDVFRSFLFTREVFRFTLETAKDAVGGPFALPDRALTLQLEKSIEATA